MTLDRLVANILGWANDRNLIEGSTVQKQYVKLVEEFGEFAAGLARGKLDVQLDAVGDQMVILAIMGAQGKVDLIGRLQKLSGTGDRSYDAISQSIQFNKDVIGVNRAFLAQAVCIGVLGEEFFDGSDDKDILAEGLATLFGNCIAMCYELNAQPNVVLEDVWNIIKDRKGRMVDGAFVKEGDAMVAGSSNAQ